MSPIESRRSFLLASGAALAGLVAWRWRPVPGLTPIPGAPKLVTIVEFTDAGDRKSTVSVPMIEKTDAEWKALLPPLSYEVTRHADTETPFTGSLLSVHDKGVFRCICCDTAVFSSATKFDSG
ncbi:MAG TPA: peptide-methionine (R)-S-oxide reductase, partial [Gemmatimonadales bacterium]|nr:peptide-methionine (R)-S-oxide reductase [Gemmatimonadales bacterium]